MWVCVKLDVDNAHNAMARAAILETVETEQSLRHLPRLVSIKRNQKNVIIVITTFGS